MEAPLTLIDLSHTSHTRARTGVQRVCRSLTRALAGLTGAERTRAITWDPFGRRWRGLTASEAAVLANDDPGRTRGAAWPISLRLRGWSERARGGAADALPAVAQVIVPEIFSAAVGRALPRLFSAVAGPRVALFHDAIALRLPELSPRSTVARFPLYLQQLLAFDGVAAVSRDSHDALVDWWRWLRVPTPPPVTTIALAADAPARDRVLARTTRIPVVLSVGSIEGRKNHRSLLEAAETLWTEGLAFELRLVGLAQAETGRTVVAEIRRLQQRGRALRYDGPLDERALNAAYHECAFTVYPSLMEGFGLPVLESVGYGKPCVCSAHGALGEAARAGGCLALDRVDPSSLADAMRSLLSHPARRQALAEAALVRPIRTWESHATELLEWMRSLPRGPAIRS